MILYGPSNTLFTKLATNPYNSENITALMWHLSSVVSTMKYLKNGAKSSNVFRWLIWFYYTPAEMTASRTLWINWSSRITMNHSPINIIWSTINRSLLETFGTLEYFIWKIQLNKNKYLVSQKLTSPQSDSLGRKGKFCMTHNLEQKIVLWRAPKMYRYF